MLITPLPGADRGNLLQALTKTRDEVQNLYTSGPRGAIPRMIAYLGWANDAMDALAGQISARDIDRLVLTRRYEQILGNVGVLGTGDTAPLANGMLNLELRQRTDDFNQAVDALRRAIDDREHAALHAVFDSTVFINHEDKIRDIDFRELTGVYEGPVNLAIPMAVLDELDGLKQHSDKHARWRAGYTLAVIDDLFSARQSRVVLHNEDLEEAMAGGLPRPKVTVELLFDSPGHIRLPINDDEIIDRALAFRALTGSEVRLFTFDTSQASRARFVGLDVTKLKKPIGDEPAPRA